AVDAIWNAIPEVFIFGAKISRNKIFAFFCIYQNTLTPWRMTWRQINIYAGYDFHIPIHTHELCPSVKPSGFPTFRQHAKHTDVRAVLYRSDGVNDFLPLYINLSIHKKI